MGRYEKAEALIELILQLQSSYVGLSIDDISDRFGVSRRTAERMRNTVRVLFPELEERVMDDRIKRWRLPSRRAQGLIRWRAEELAALDTATEFAGVAGRSEHAALLRSLTDKIRSLIDSPTAHRLEPDVEALTEAEGLAARPGPSSRVTPGVIEALREGILACRCVRLDYRRSRTGERVERAVHPYGFLYGNRHYLVAYTPEGDHFRIAQLTGIDRVELLPEYFERREDFDLRAFAARSFGVFQEEPFNVVWRFAPEATAGARTYVFHPTQEFEEQEDGSLIVRFQAGGLQEMAFHAFTWGGLLEVLEPKELRELLREMAEEVAGVHAGASNGVVPSRTDS
jgi:predicted DNA-binding transcriptional regulator YafY